MTRVPPIAQRDIVRITQRWNPPHHYGTDYSCVEGPDGRWHALGR